MYVRKNDTFKNAVSSTPVTKENSQHETGICNVCCKSYIYRNIRLLTKYYYSNFLFQDFLHLILTFQ